MILTMVGNLFIAFVLAGITICLPVELLTGIPYRDLVHGPRVYLNAGIATAVWWYLLMRFAPHW